MRTVLRTVIFSLFIHEIHMKYAKKYAKMGKNQKSHIWYNKLNIFSAIT